MQKSIYNYYRGKEINMTYLEKWFDFNRRQVELEALLEQTIAEQSDQSLTLKEFYLLHFFKSGSRKIFWDRLTCLTNSIWVQVLYHEWWHA